MNKNSFECGDALQLLPALDASSIHLTVTSPPYDSLRTYGGHSFSLETAAALATELFRVTVAGGVCCWIVQDQIKDGSHSLTSFRHALCFQEAGWTTHNIIVLDKYTSRGIQPNRYGVAPEFVFVFGKGGPPRVANILRDKLNKRAGKMISFTTRDKEDGSILRTKRKLIAPYGRRGNVWKVPTGGKLTTSYSQAYQHPSLMPEALARDLVLSWSNPLDLVLDPMAGAGTSLVSALLNDRYYLGYEIHVPYYRLALERLQRAHVEYLRRLSE